MAQSGPPNSCAKKFSQDGKVGEGDWANFYGKEGYQPVVGTTRQLVGMVLSMGAGCSHKGKWVYSVFSPKGFCWDNFCWNVVFIPRFKRWLKAFFFLNFHCHCLSYLWAVFYSLLSMHHMPVGIFNMRGKAEMFEELLLSMSPDKLLSEEVTTSFPWVSNSILFNSRESYGLQLTRLYWALIFSSFAKYLSGIHYLRCFLGYHERLRYLVLYCKIQQLLEYSDVLTIT